MDKKELLKEIIKWAEIQKYHSAMITNNEESVLLYDYKNRKVIVVDLKKKVISGRKLDEYSNLGNSLFLEGHEYNFFKYYGFSYSGYKESFEEKIYIERPFKVYKGNIKFIQEELEKQGYKKESFVNYLTMEKRAGIGFHQINYDPANHILMKYEREASYQNWKQIKLNKEEYELLYREYKV